MNTIFALATSRAKSGVAIIRISGPQAFGAGQIVCGDLPPSHQVGTRLIRDAMGEVIDHALVLPFKAPKSFTGDDVVELHLHGSLAIVNAILRLLSEQSGLRQAEPGEFTRRALENNRLDLAQVEGLADLIEAETEAQRKQALRVFAGALGERAAQWRTKAVRAAALVEATIDFADEDVPEDVTDEVLVIIEDLTKELLSESEGSRVAERIRDGFEVAIVGAPNVGKSTLLNALAGRDAAITSEVAGTTRDVIEVRMDINGLPVTFLDTAGLRDTKDTVEKLGISRAKERAEAADLRLFLIEDDKFPPDFDPKGGDIITKAKVDLYECQEFGVSGLTGKGLSSLIAQIQERLEERISGSQTAIRARHRHAIDRAMVALSDAKIKIEENPYLTELAAEDLRTATRALDSLIGRVDVDDLLDEIFSSFCLGK